MEIHLAIETSQNLDTPIFTRGRTSKKIKTSTFCTTWYKKWVHYNTIDAKNGRCFDHGKVKISKAKMVECKLRKFVQLWSKEVTYISTPKGSMSINSEDGDN